MTRRRKRMPEELRVNGYLVSNIQEVETKRVVSTLKVSLLWLRESGFKGRVQVIDGNFGDSNDSSKVLFEIDV